MTSPSESVPSASPETRRHSRAADYLALTKPRLNLLVLVTTMAAYYLGLDHALPVAVAVHTAIGTALVAGGAAALNQLWERESDARMRRTVRRPLPAERLRPADARRFGILLSVAGLAELALGVNVLAASVALVTLLSYVVWYTPLKLRTSLSTVVGAIPGALPTLIGWAGATGTLSYDGWVLFAIVFLWQMPHFLAIAWMYRDDYAQAGMPMLPVIEPDGRSTGRQAVIYSAALLPVSLLPVLSGLATFGYLVGATALAAIVLWLSAEFAATRTMATARRLFYGTILYLPLLLGLLLRNHVRPG